MQSVSARCKPPVVSQPTNRSPIEDTTLASASVSPSSSTADKPAASAGSSNPAVRLSTAHLKQIPGLLAERESIRARCRTLVASMDRSCALSLVRMEELARQTLDHLELPEAYVGWTMVVLASEFWGDQVAAVPPERRLLLLPHCLKHVEACRADYNEMGLDCQRCGACSIGEFAGVAEKMGYHVLVAEGSPIVMQIILSGRVDAILGVACLNVLEKAIDKVLIAGIPCMAVPLLSNKCRDTQLDESWVWDMIKTRCEAAPLATRSYVHLMRAATGMFEPDRLTQLAPPMRGGPLVPVSADALQQLDPIAVTEAIAYDFLRQGGKYSRPFITLAVHDALTGARATESAGAEHLGCLPEAVLRTALSIEAFHKASLVHDDIEDDDPFRYGNPTTHRRFGAAVAINVGDYLIGMGYRLVSREIQTLGAEKVADILHCLADAHTRLTEGQGAELAWRDAPHRWLTPIDALKIYALKTAPAFEAALLVGVRLAQPLSGYGDTLRRYARNLGVAFQILNDLADWEKDDGNKLIVGRDVLGQRPTLLWALALEATGTEGHETLRGLLSDESVRDDDRIRRVYQFYRESGALKSARLLIDKHRRRAQDLADEIAPDDLRRLLRFLIDTVLRHPCVTEEIA